MSGWKIAPSVRSLNTVNPVREALQYISLPTDFPLPTYSLGLGDPTKFPDFAASPVLIQAVSECLVACKGNGYTDSVGLPEARETLSREYSYENIQLTPSDVIMDMGGTGAIHTVLQLFLNPGDNILIPSPGFPLYKTMALNMSAEAFPYKLKPNCNWEVDFDDLESKITPRSKLLVVVNPSNPCGSVFSREHLLEILAWAERHEICVLADELYHNMTFGKPFFPLGSLTDAVPVFTIGALSKMFLVPGWRCGWTLIYDKYNKCQEFRDAIQKVKNMLIHPVPFIMQAIPSIYQNLPKNYYEEVMAKVRERAEVVQRKVREIRALSMAMPEGALYCMISVDLTVIDMENTVVFAQKLASEHGVLVIPGEAFLSESSFRVVLCQPVYVIEECMERIRKFVESHVVN